MSKFIFTSQTNPPPDYSFIHTSTDLGAVNLSLVDRVISEGYGNGYGNIYPSIYFRNIKVRWLYTSKVDRDSDYERILYQLN